MAMAVAARVDPKSYFTPEEGAPLARRSAWVGPALVAHCWAVIALCWVGVMAASHYLGWFWPLTLLISTPIIGGRQLGLGILQHDAAHGALHPDPKVGDFISDVF
jgi:fatty acid desaturase